MKASDGRWGYTCNPNAKWDWWQIGGRFPNRFLVPAGLQDCIPSAKDDDGESATPPEGYQYADAARKKDICWDVMRKIAVDTVSGQRVYIDKGKFLSWLDAQTQMEKRDHYGW